MPAALLSITLAPMAQASVDQRAAPPPGGIAVEASTEDMAYLQGRLMLANHQLLETEKLIKSLPKDSSVGAELAWRLAHAQRDPKRIANAALRYCGVGDPTGRACVDAELFQARMAPVQVDLPSKVTLPLAPQAPFPLTLAHVGGVKTGVVLDTGASQTVVSRTLANKLGLKGTTKGFPIGVAAGGAVAEAQLAMLPELKLGEATVRNIPVMIVDLPQLDAVNISVILSPQHVLEGLHFTIDYPNHRFSMWRGQPEPAAPGAVSVPYLFAGFDLVVEAGVGDGPSALFGFDTGMEGAWAVSSDYSRQCTTPQQVGTMQGAGGQAQVQNALAMPVRLGTSTFHPAGDCIISDMQRQDMLEIAGLLGNGLWKDHTVSFDTVDHRIVIAPVPVAAR